MRASNTLVLIMKNRRVSGRKLSEITGICRSAISQIVNGRLLPTDHELRKICCALGVTPSQIYPIPGMLEMLQMAAEEEAESFNRLGLFEITSRRPDESDDGNGADEKCAVNRRGEEILPGRSSR